MIKNSILEESDITRQKNSDDADKWQLLYGQILSAHGIRNKGNSTRPCDFSSFITEWDIPWRQGRKYVITKLSLFSWN